MRTAAIALSCHSRQSPTSPVEGRERLQRRDNQRPDGLAEVVLYKADPGAGRHDRPRSDERAVAKPLATKTLIAVLHAARRKADVSLSAAINCPSF